MSCAVSDEREFQRDIDGLSPYQSHRSLLRRADYTCSEAGLLRVSRADAKLQYEVVDGHPRLYAKYTCHDGLVLKNRSIQYMYCSNRKWIGVPPTCVIGRLHST